MSCTIMHAVTPSRPEFTLEIKALWPRGWVDLWDCSLLLRSIVPWFSFHFTCLLIPAQSPHCGQQHFKHFLQMHLEHFKPLECPFTSQSSIKNPTHPTKLKWAPLSRETFASNPSWKWSCPPLLNPHNSFSFNYKNILRTNYPTPLTFWTAVFNDIFRDLLALSYTVNFCNLKTDNLCSNSSSC